MALFKKIPWMIIGLLAVSFAVLRANTLCWWIAHEPEMPKEVKSLKIFK